MRNKEPIRPHVSLRPIRRGIEVLPLLFMIILTALLWGAVTTILHHEKDREIERAFQRLDYLRRTFQEHSLNTLTTADQILRLLKAEFEERPSTREFSEFRQAVERSAIIVQLGVIGANGNLQWSNQPFKPINLADREHFQVHVERDSGQVFISKPVLGRASGKWSIQLSRRLNHRDGSFAGVVVASVDAHYLGRFYQEVGLQPGAVLGLVGHDKVVRVRVTDQEVIVGRSLGEDSPLLKALGANPEGHFLAPSSMDGIRRLYSYGQMPGQPLVVFAGFDEARVLAAYGERAYSYYQVASICSAILLLTGMFLWWLLLRLRQARQEVEAAHAVFSAAPDPMVMLQRDRSGLFHYRYFNPSAQALAGRRAEEMQHHALDQVLTPDDALRRQLMLDETVRSGEVQEAEQTMSYPGGERTVRWTAVPVHDGSEHISHVALIGHDLTQLREEQRQLWLSDAIVAQTHEAVMVTDASERIFRVNPAFCLMTGYSPEEVLDHSPGLLASGVHDVEFYHHMHQALQSRGFWQGELWQRRKDGQLFACLLDISTLHDSEGRLTHYVHVFSDITEQKHLAEQMEHLAHFDGLTQLPNRNLFQDRVCQALARAERNGTGLALMFMDLDGFKAVNDSAGHNTGDRLLVEVARRITSVLRKVDSVSRQGGDEFTVLLENINNGQGVQETEEAAQRIIAAINEPVLLDGRSFRVGASIGIAFYPADGDNVELLMARADAAMYQAKARGKNRHLCWTPELAPGEA